MTWPEMLQVIFVSEMLLLLFLVLGWWYCSYFISAFDLFSCFVLLVELFFFPPCKQKIMTMTDMVPIPTNSTIKDDTAGVRRGVSQTPSGS